jgi:hypothetical protein
MEHGNQSDKNEGMLFKPSNALIIEGRKQRLSGGD